MIAEVPLRIVALEVVFCQSGRAVGSRIQAQTGVRALDARHVLRHDAEGAVRQLFDAPQLFLGSRKLRNRCQLLIGGSCQCTFCAGNGDFEVGKNKSSSATISLSLYYQMRLGKDEWKDGKYVFEGIEESLSGSYSITFKQYIQCNCEWYDYDKNEWHFDYCTDTATATGKFKGFLGRNSSYMRDGSQWSCTAFSGIPLSHEAHDSFLQRVGDNLVPRHIDATLDDLLSLKAKTEAEIAAGGVPYWDNGRGFVVIDLDLDLNKYGDADPNDFDYGRRSPTYEEVL